MTMTDYIRDMPFFVEGERYLVDGQLMTFVRVAHVYDTAVPGGYYHMNWRPKLEKVYIFDGQHGGQYHLRDYQLDDVQLVAGVAA